MLIYSAVFWWQAGTFLNIVPPTPPHTPQHSYQATVHSSALSVDLRGQENIASISVLLLDTNWEPCYWAGASRSRRSSHVKAINSKKVTQFLNS